MGWKKYRGVGCGWVAMVSDFISFWHCCRMQSAQPVSPPQDSTTTESSGMESNRFPFRSRSPLLRCSSASNGRFVPVPIHVRYVCSGSFSSWFPSRPRRCCCSRRRRRRCCSSLSVIFHRVLPRRTVSCDSTLRSFTISKNR